MKWQRFRTVVEEAQASQSIATLKRQHERFSDQWDGFVWHVCREPEEFSSFTEIEGKEYRLSHRKGDMKFGLPDITVIYTFDDDIVTIIDVAAWDSFKDES